MEEDRITAIVIASAIKVHRALGPGLLESAYRNGLAHDLRLQKLRIEVEKTLPLIYAGIRTNKGYRLDLFVEKKVVVEVKADLLQGGCAGRFLGIRHNNPIERRVLGSLSS